MCAWLEREREEEMACPWLFYKHARAENEIFDLMVFVSVRRPCKKEL